MSDFLKWFLQFLLLVQTLFYLGLAGYTLSLKAVRLKKPFSLLMLSMAVYSLGAFMEPLRMDLPWMLLWNNFTYLGLVWLGPLWLIVAGRYGELPVFRNRRFLALLFLLPVLTLLFKYSDPLFHLFYRAVWMSGHDNPLMVGFSRGPWYWAHMAYASITVAAGLLVLFWVWFTSASAYKRQIALFVTAGLLPFLFLLVYIVGSPAFPFDIIPLSFLLSAPLFLVSLVRFRFLETRPLTVSTALEILNSGLILLDSRGNLVEVNRTVRELLEGGESLSLPVPFEEAVSLFPYLKKLDLALDEQNYQVWTEAGGRLCSLRVFGRRLVSPDGVFVGMSIVLFFGWKDHAEEILPGPAEQRDMESLTRLMEQEKLYLDPELTLNGVSRHLGIPRNRISWVINQHFRKNFNDYINGYRVNHAAALMEAGKTNILEAAFESGFNSKSVFYAAFRKATGTYPKKYAPPGVPAAGDGAKKTS